MKKMKQNIRQGIPKRDGSGRGMRLNKGRGGCNIDQQPRIGRGRALDHGRYDGLGNGRGLGRGLGQGKGQGQRQRRGRR